jgi:hypothetical protein
MLRQPDSLTAVMAAGIALQAGEEGKELLKLNNYGPYEITSQFLRSCNVQNQKFLRCGY